MFRVEYFCPRQSPLWQAGTGGWLADYRQACALAQMLKPRSPLGRARVVNSMGQVVYQV